MGQTQKERDRHSADPRKGAYYELCRRQYEEAQMEDAVRI